MEKPFIDKPEGPAPADLVIEDITVGDGAEATPGGRVRSASSSMTDMYCSGMIVEPSRTLMCTG